jgi:hypothetical protein
MADDRQFTLRKIGGEVLVEGKAAVAVNTGP